MGRTKPVAKRRRVVVEEQVQQSEAIEVLLQASPEQVEAAAAVATRQACEHWPRIDDDNDDTELPSWLVGLGRSRTVEHYEALKQLHEAIKSKARTWTSWSGSEGDPRKRAFGILPDTLGAETSIQEKLDISTPWKEDDLGEERARNHQAIVFLDKPPSSTRAAIEALCESFLENLSTSSRLRPYLQYQNLIAVQPNLHSGRALLPMHIDHPSKDGFGVIIVTVSIVGSATILLQDYSGEQKRTMRVAAGEAYMLSDKARDACTHGILADVGSEQRESLNLRFGLHDVDRGSIHPVISCDSVLQYWETKG
jgi:hypothetical protein